MRSNFTEFIRRISIIQLEDVMLHHEFPFWIWLMMANSQGFPCMNDAMAKYCLTLVSQMAQLPLKDTLPKETIAMASNTTTTTTTLLKQEEYSILLSIIIRIGFGGMQGDRNMLFEFCKLWYVRMTQPFVPLCSLYQFPTVNDCSIESNVMEYLKQLYSNEYSKEICSWNQEAMIRKEDVVLSGVDMHCSKLIDHIKEKCKIENEELISAAVWEYRSSLNCRIQVGPQCISKKSEMLENVYKKIEKEVNQYSYFVCRHNTFAK